MNKSKPENDFESGNWVSYLVLFILFLSIARLAYEVFK